MQEPFVAGLDLVNRGRLYENYGRRREDLYGMNRACKSGVNDRRTS